LALGSSLLPTHHHINRVLIQIVIVASRGGDDQHPAWFVNLRANSTVWVATQTEAKHERRARIATSEERDEMWPIIVAKYANYGGYQLKTEREIPLIFLEKV
jgi:deazaflavin-dependent oxidoreductase (nitroreductase family)